MKIKIWNTAIIFLLGIMFLSCNSKPRVIEGRSAAEEAEAISNTGGQDALASTNSVADEHKVIGEGSSMDEAHTGIQEQEGLPGPAAGQIEPAPGAVKISQLYANKEKYSNKVVKVTGKCLKVNPSIMNRNWAHIQDGSGENIDLTVTTMEDIPLGAVVTLEGTIALDKDFGAGYRYDVIMEGAILQ